MYKLNLCSLEVFMERTTLISPADVEQQLAFCQSVAELTARWPEGNSCRIVFSIPMSSFLQYMKKRTGYSCPFSNFFLYSVQ